MPESVVREELEAMDIHVRAVMQLRSGRRDKDPSKELPPNTPLHCIRGVGVLSITELFGLRMSVESYVAPKVPCNANAASASDTRSVTADKRTLVRRVWWRSPHRWVIIPREQPQCCAC